MKKQRILFHVVVMVLVLTGCSNESPLPNTTSDPVEVISTPVEIRLGGNMVNPIISRAAIEDNATDIEMGVFALAREIIASGNQRPGGIQWWGNTANWSDHLMKNVLATKSGSEVTLDGHYFYPATQFYGYDFYAYYPRVADAALDTTENNALYVDYELDGKTEILWGRATSTDAYAYSAKYFLQDADHSTNESYLPVLQLKHMLTRLVFIAVPGESYEGSEDYTAASKMQVISVRVVDAKKNVRLNIANLTDDLATKATWAAGTDVTWKNRLELIDDEEGVFALCKSDGSAFAPTMVPATPLSPVHLGESLLLYPQETYTLRITLKNTADDAGLAEDDPARYFDSEIPLEISTGEGAFEQGKSYNIQLNIRGPREIAVKANLNDWIEDNSISINLN